MQPGCESSAAERVHCVLCGLEFSKSKVRTARVRCNVKRFVDETFGVWQCPQCASIHALDQVDLDHYYAAYPFHLLRMTFPLRLVFRKRLRRLRRLGLTSEHRLLDYGCGAGLFVRYLRECGYRHARGYDVYARTGPHAEPPGRGYDMIVCQDVIEHVDSPRACLQTLADMAKPGGLVVVGTPNAEAADLGRPEDYIHLLHQPYHRHILSLRALTALAGALELDVVNVNRGYSGSSAVPGLNDLYLGRVLKAHGDTIDDTLAGKASLKWELVTPSALWDACTGAWRDPEHDMTLALRVPDRAVRPRAAG